MKVSLSKRNNEPLKDRGIKIEYGEPKRKGYRWQRYLIAAILIIPFLFMGWRFAVNSLSITANGQITLSEELIAAPESGYVTPFVAKKNTLEAGTVLGELTIQPLRSQDASERTIQQEQKRIEKEARLISIREREALQTKELDIYSKLFEKGAATRAELRIAQMQYQTIRDERLLLEGEIKAINNTINSVPLTGEKPTTIVLYTVSGGVLEEAPRQTQWVEVGTPIFRIVDPGSLPQVFVYLEPQDTKHIRDGEKVTLAFANGLEVNGRLNLNSMETVKRSWQKSPNDLQPSTLLLRAEIQPDKSLPDPLRVNGMPFTVKLGWRFF